jgi:hypothetical protein
MRGFLFGGHMTPIKELLRETEPYRDLIDRLDLDFIEKIHSTIDPNKVWEVGKVNTSTFTYGRTVKEALDNYRTRYPQLTL